jgi:hypothetical protein
MTMRFAAATALLLLAAGCAATPDPQPVAAAAPRPEPTVVGGQRLSGEEFRQLVFGNTLDRRLPNGTRLLMHVGADGGQRLRIVAGNGQRATDRGQVRIQGDEICANWERIDQGRATCFAYFRLGESLVAIDLSGTMTPTRFSLLQGNPEGL